MVQYIKFVDLQPLVVFFFKANHTSPDETIVNLENKNYLLEQRTQQMEVWIGSILSIWSYVQKV